MNIRSIAVVAALVLASGVVAGAHEGHVHRIMGTVMARDAKHVEVKTPSGEVLSIALTAKTIVLKSNKKADLAAVNKGTRVVVDIGNGEDPLIAREIQVGVTKITEP